MTEAIPPHVLLGAYSQGVFPMADDGELHWFSPLRRGVMPLDERFHIPHGLERRLRRCPFELRMNTDFAGVMAGCADREQTWIDATIMESYTELFKLGFAHSVEGWDGEGLQGGRYGVRLQRAFFGESMFSRKTDASKVALVGLVDWLRAEGVILLDTQWLTPHLATFGGFEMTRAEYLEALAEAIGGE